MSPPMLVHGCIVRLPFGTEGVPNVAAARTRPAHIRIRAMNSSPFVSGYAALRALADVPIFQVGVPIVAAGCVSRPRVADVAP